MASGAPERKRKRGVTLTSQGIKKLRAAIFFLEDEENFGQRLTISELGFRTRLTPDTVAKVLDAEQGVDRRTLDSFFRTLNLELSESDYCLAGRRSAAPSEAVSAHTLPPSTEAVQVDWGEAPDISIFYGRTQELRTLSQWIEVDRCRIINLLGMGGIGKTSLVTKLVERFASRHDPPAPEFEHIIWRSLRHAPPVEEILREILQILSHQPDLDIPNSLNQAISQLMQILQQSRCLLVLDHVEAILQPKEQSGCYRVGFEGYGELIRRIGESPHHSCLILTSREQLHEIRLLAGKAYPVRSHLLKGLLPQDSLRILQAEGIDEGQSGWQTLLNQYAGNPLALKMAATSIQFVFSGQVDCFLAQGAAAFGQIYNLLQEQFVRLSDLEKTVVYWLAIHREPVLLPNLINAFVPPITRQKLLGAMENLGWRSLLESVPTGFTLQTVVMDFVTHQFIDQVADELQQAQLNLVHRHVLLQPTAKAAVRAAQTKFILKPIADRAVFTEAHWNKLLETCNSQPYLASGYAAENLRNLLSCRKQLLSSSKV